MNIQKDGNYAIQCLHRPRYEGLKAQYRVITVFCIYHAKTVLQLRLSEYHKPHVVRNNFLAAVHFFRCFANCFQTQPASAPEHEQWHEVVVQLLYVKLTLFQLWAVSWKKSALTAGSNWATLGLSSAIWSASGSTAASSVIFVKHPPLPTNSSSMLPYPQPIMAHDLIVDSCGKASLICARDWINISRFFVLRSIVFQGDDDDAAIFVVLILSHFCRRLKFQSSLKIQTTVNS